MSPRLAFAINAVWNAGRSTLALYQNLGGFEAKADMSPVTAADHEAERIIRAEIEKAFPGEAVLGEEQGLTGFGDDRWVVDPIDGTKSFVAGTPLYATLLSYEQDGEPILGVAYFPALNEMLYAENGEGAWWNGRRCQVSGKATIDQSVICHAGIKGLANFGHLAGMATVADRAMAARTWCDAYGHALVATGRAEAMFDPIVTRWDVSALIPVIREAGGKCSRLDGESSLIPIHEGGGLQFLSSNGLVHEEISGILTP